MEITTVGTGEGFMYVFYQGVVSRFRNIEAQFVIKGALIKVPVSGLGAG